jgi:hypothetical protein
VLDGQGRSTADGEEGRRPCRGTGVPGEYLTDEVHGPLHSERMALLAALDYNRAADNMSCRRNVK